MRFQSIATGMLVVFSLCGRPAACQGQDAASAIQFSEHLIADKYAYAYGIAAADLDRDGDLDLTSADYTPHNRLYLFENDSRANFKRHIVQK